MQHKCTFLLLGPRLGIMIACVQPGPLYKIFTGNGLLLTLLGGSSWGNDVKARYNKWLCLLPWKVAYC